jgi:hypothetical protein
MGIVMSVASLQGKYGTNRWVAPYKMMHPYPEPKPARKQIQPPLSEASRIKIERVKRQIDLELLI